MDEMNDNIPEDRDLYSGEADLPRVDWDADLFPLPTVEQSSF